MSIYAITVEFFNPTSRDYNSINFSEEGDYNSFRF